MVAKLEIKSTKDIYKRCITKRSFKNFTSETWKNSLQSKDWKTVESSTNLDEMVETFNNLITDALDEIAPV